MADQLRPMVVVLPEGEGSWGSDDTHGHTLDCPSFGQPMGQELCECVKRQLALCEIRARLRERLGPPRPIDPFAFEMPLALPVPSPPAAGPRHCFECGLVGHGASGCPSVAPHLREHYARTRGGIEFAEDEES